VTSWLENQKCIFTKENTIDEGACIFGKTMKRKKRLTVWPNPIQSNPCPTMRQGRRVSGKLHWMSLKWHHSIERAACDFLLRFN